MEKERRTKALLLSALVVVVATLSIAFAAMSRTLSINGIGKMDTASWDVHFENLSDATIVSGAEEIGKPKISDDRGTVQDINVKLKNPKDEISYTVDIVNDGTIDAEVNVLTMSDMTDAEKKLIDFSVYYLNGTKINKYDLIEAGKNMTIKIVVKYKDDITEFDLPSEPMKINLSCQIEYVQSDSEVVITPNGGLETVTSVLATAENPSKPVFLNGALTKGNVESISFLGTLKVPQDVKDTAFDASANKDGSVVVWYTDLDGNGFYEVNIGGNGKVVAPSNCNFLFGFFKKLKEVNFNGNFDTSNVTNMSQMFHSCSNLTTLDLSSLDFSSVEDINSIFIECSNLTNINFGTSNMSNVKLMSAMFSGCTSLTSLDLSSFDTTNVTDMHSMFDNCTSLTSLDLSSFDTTNVTDMHSMFDNCKKLTSLNISNWNTSKVTNMSGMFQYCTNVKNLSINHFDTASVTNMSSMFYECDFVTLNLSSFNTENVTDMSRMFNRCWNLETLNVNGWNTSKVTNMEGMFEYCTNLKNLSINHFNTSNVTNMGYIFRDCNLLTSIDLSSWNTSNCSYFGAMFNGCENLSLIKMNNADFSKDIHRSFSLPDYEGKITIYVKDETAKQYIEACNSGIGAKQLNIIIEPLSA